MRAVLIFYSVMTKEKMTTNEDQNTSLLPDLTNAEEARKAFIANEIFNRKY